MVDRKDLFRLQIHHRFLQIFRRGVDIFPIVIILAVFKESQVDRTEAFADLRKAFVIATIASYIDLSAGVFDVWTASR